LGFSEKQGKSELTADKQDVQETGTYNPEFFAYYRQFFHRGCGLLSEQSFSGLAVGDDGNEFIQPGQVENSFDIGFNGKEGDSNPFGIGVFHSGDENTEKRAIDEIDLTHINGDFLDAGRKVFIEFLMDFTANTDGSFGLIDGNPEDAAVFLR